MVVACVAEKSGFYLRVPSESAREWLADVLAQNGAGEVSVRADSETEKSQARGPWLALGLGIGAVALFAWSLIN
ncbi:MAG TPA: hypothetical protein VFF06_31000 [Polyangia bacterium]|nr:hypothetical protein [Polyangia bacterium]